MPNNNRDIIVRVKSDASEMLKGYEQAIKELEKYSNKAQPFNSMQSEIDELKKGINDLKKNINSIGSTRIDSSQIDKLIQKLDSQSEKIRELQKNQKAIKINVDESSGKKAVETLQKADSLVKQLTQTIKPLQDLGLNIDTNGLNNATEKVKGFENQINRLQKQLSSLKNEEVNPFDNISEGEAIDKLRAKLKEYNELKNKIQNGNFVNIRELNDAKIKLGEFAKEIDQISVQIKSEVPEFDLFDLKTLETETAQAGKIIKSRINNLYAEIGKTVSESELPKVDVSNFTLKDGKISVPLQISSTLSELSGQITRLLAEVQSKVWSDNITLTIPLKFTSSYKTQVNEELKEIQGMVDKVGDVELKNDLTKQVENLTKQLTERDLRLEFKSNIEEINKDVNSNLNSIKKSLREAKLYLYPEIEIDKKSQEKIQKTLDNISKALKINLGIENLDINKLLNEEEINKVRESFNKLDIKISPKIALTDKDITNISNNLKKQLNKLNISIDTSKLESGIKSALDNTIIDRWKSKFISTIDEVVAKIEKAFGKINNNNFYEAMKSWYNADTIMRDNRVGVKTHNGRVDTTQETTAYGELERVALVNSKTNEILGDHLVDQAHSVSGNIQEALKELSSSIGRSASEFYDTIIHSHPVSNKTTKNGEVYKGVGSNIAFSSQDLTTYKGMLQEGFKKIMVESNGMINELDLSSLSKKLVEEIVQEYENATNNLIKTYKERGRSINDLYDKTNKTINHTLNSNVLNETLSSIIESKGLDSSKYLKQYNIEDLKLNVEDFAKEEQEINNLVKLLMEMSSALTEINKNSITLDTGEITSQIKSLIDAVIELKKLFESFSNNTFNISTEPIERIISAIDKMTISIQKAFGLATDADISNQWEIIENKFKSIADETGKINLVKQKKEVKELIEEYDKYINMGGQNTFGNLTDNSKTISKLEKQYEKLNAAKQETEDIDKKDKNTINLKVDIDQSELITQINNIVNTINNTINSGDGVNKIEILPEISETSAKELNAFISNISSIDSNKLDSFYNVLNSIASVLKEISQIDNISNIFNNINVKDNQIKNLNQLPDILKNIAKELNNITLTTDSNNFLTQINNIITQADALKDLSSILKETKSKIKEAAKAVGNDINTSNDSNQEFNKQNNDLVEVGKISEKVNNEIINSENEKQKEYKESANALETLKNAQVGTAEAFRKTSDSFNNNFSDPNQQAKRFFEEYAKNIANNPGLAESKYSINTDSQGNFKSATIEYYNDNLKQTITETWKWHEANEKIAGDMDRMVVTNINYKDSILQWEKAIDSSNSYLNKQVEKLKDIQSLYDMDINPNTKKGIKNQEDLDVLRSKTEEIFRVINENIGTNITQEFKDNLTSMINDLERTRKSFTDKEYGATELSPKELSINKDIVGSQYDELIAKTKSAGDYTSDLTNRLINAKKAIDNIGDSAGLKTASDQLKSFRTEFSKLKAENTDYNNNLSVINNYEKEVSKLIELQAKQDFGNGEWGEQILVQSEKVEEAAEKARKAFDVISNLLNENKINQEQYGSASNLFDWAQNGSKQSLAKYADAAIAYQEKVQNAIKETQVELSKLRNIDGTDVFQKMFANSSSYIDELNNKLLNNEIGLKEYNNEIKNLFNNLKGNENTIKVIEPKNIQAGITEMQKLMNIMSQNKAEVKQLDEQNGKLTFTYTDQNRQLHNVIFAYDQITGSIKVLKNTTATAKSSIEKLFDSFAQKWKNVFQYLTSFGTLYTVWNSFKQGFTYVRELDTALTEMRKVSDETTQSLREFQEASFDIADSVGATAQVVQNSTAEWMRLGESLEQAAESAQVSNILLNVSEFENIDDATESLVAMSQAYNEFDKIDIVDKLNNIGM